ncbi:hypothetical protein V5799_029358 [Amblyomma americanum]|uniref:UBC core domain-containing protein n=1 Tax=Amblyomma americanum TaxID=6943 RepID=A0AAQ4ERF2_AMBAM
MASPNQSVVQDSRPSSSDKPQSSTDVLHSSALKRLQQEVVIISTYDNDGITAIPDEDNLFHWSATIQGPVGTVYEGSEYNLSLQFSTRYPVEPPRVGFETPCFHPNIGDQGNICVDILNEIWTALLNVRTLLLSIQTLLAWPNVSSPLNGYAADLWRDQERYRRARESFEAYHKRRTTPPRLEDNGT